MRMAPEVVKTSAPPPLLKVLLLLKELRTRLTGPESEKTAIPPPLFPAELSLSSNEQFSTVVKGAVVKMERPPPFTDPFPFLIVKSLTVMWALESSERLEVAMPITRFVAPPSRLVRPGPAPIRVKE